jgi:hypothetical protein
MLTTYDPASSPRPTRWGFCPNPTTVLTPHLFAVIRPSAPAKLSCASHEPALALPSKHRQAAAGGPRYIDAHVRQQRTEPQQQQRATPWLSLWGAGGEGSGCRRSSRARCSCRRASPAAVGRCVSCVCLDFWVWCFGAQRSYLPVTQSPHARLGLARPLGRPPIRAAEAACQRRAEPCPSRIQGMGSVVGVLGVGAVCAGARGAGKKRCARCFKGGAEVGPERRGGAEGYFPQAVYMSLHSLVHPNPSHQFR